MQTRMSRRKSIKLLGSILGLSCLSGMSRVTGQPPQPSSIPAPRLPAGIVEPLVGMAEVQRGGSGAPVRCAPKKGGILLYPGDRFRLLTKGDRARITLYDRTAALQGPFDWRAVAKIGVVKDDIRRDALERIGRVGGRPRAGTSALFAPSPDTALRLRPTGALPIRWNPEEAPVSFILFDEGGTIVWRGQPGPGTAGRLLDREELALGKLVQKRREASGQTRYIACLAFAEPPPPASPAGVSKSQKSAFRILSPAEETALKTDLARWQGETGLMASLGRIVVLEKYGLFFEAAEEWDTVLRLAPNSPEVRTAARDAWSRVGNRERVARLSSR